MPSDSDNEDLDDSWKNLKTITTFDGYDGVVSTIGSTKVIGGSLIETISSKATTPVSLLVESLVQQLCTMLDPDPYRCNKLYQTICQQLYKMNLIDNTYAMGEFELMRSQYQKALHQLVSIAKEQDLPPTMQSVWPLTQPVGMDWSRYHREFDEISFIAGGGFGTVYKARHKLDETNYAIKKIIIKSKTISRVLSHLAEVKTLASLHHINIVAYKAAWLEPLLIDDNEGRSIEHTLTTANTDNDDDSYTVESIKYPINLEPAQPDETSDFIEFKRDDDNDGNNADSCAVGQKSPIQIVSKKVIYKYQKQNNSCQFANSQPHVQLKWATLYIQMSLCQLTLRDWLDARNKASSLEEFYMDFVHKSMEGKVYRQFNHCDQDHDDDEDNSEHIFHEKFDSNSFLKHSNVVLNILSQLISGLKYIHSRSIIHHDVKPSNIFVGCENDRKITVQLGDFGLACPLQNEHTEVIVGTPTYAAPEQLQGLCKPKSDIYSLGIVLVELLLGFKTDMERIKTIEIIKKAKNESELPESIPIQFRNLIYSMLRRHKYRPDILQLIEMVKKIKTESYTTEVNRKLNELNTQVNNLRIKINENVLKHCEITAKDYELKIKDAELQLKNKEIERLQKQISEMQSKDKEIERLKQLLNNQDKNNN